NSGFPGQPSSGIQAWPARAEALGDTHKPARRRALPVDSPGKDTRTGDCKDVPDVWGRLRYRQRAKDYRGHAEAPAKAIQRLWHFVGHFSTEVIVVLSSDLRGSSHVSGRRTPAPQDCIRLQG